MEEILFRAKVINRDLDAIYRTNYRDGDWVFGLLTRNEDKTYNLCAQMTDMNGVSGIDIDINTLGQYTGRTDKNGKKVFKGDVLMDIEGGIYTVVYDNQYIRFAFEQDNIKWGLENFDSINYFKVIGNIFDNPELLEENNGNNS